MLPGNYARRLGPLAFRQSRRNGRCSRRKSFTIMARLHHESQDAKPQSPTDRQRRAADPKPFEGVERRRNPGGPPGVDVPSETTEVNVFHELGKALTSSLQLDQVLRTIMEKINEVL